MVGGGGGGGRGVYGMCVFCQTFRHEFFGRLIGASFDGWMYIVSQRYHLAVTLGKMSHMLVQGLKPPEISAAKIFILEQELCLRLNVNKWRWSRLKVQRFAMLGAPHKKMSVPRANTHASRHLRCTFIHFNLSCCCCNLEDCYKYFSM